MGRISGENFWGKFPGKISGENFWGKFPGKISRENFQGKFPGKSSDKTKVKKYISFNSLENNNFCNIDGTGGGNSCFNNTDYPETIDIRKSCKSTI